MSGSDVTNSGAPFRQRVAHQSTTAPRLAGDFQKDAVIASRRPPLRSRSSSPSRYREQNVQLSIARMKSILNFLDKHIKDLTCNVLINLFRPLSNWMLSWWLCLYSQSDTTCSRILGCIISFCLYAIWAGMDSLVRSVYCIALSDLRGYHTLVWAVLHFIQIRSRAQSLPS